MSNEINLNDIHIQYLKLKNELETNKQNLYECQRQLKVSEALQSEYQNEIEILQSEENRKSAQLKSKIIQQEELLAALKASQNERVIQLESELTKKDEKILELTNEIDLLKKLSTKSLPHDDNELFDQISSLQQENKALMEINQELKDSLSIHQKQNQTLEENVQTYERDLNEIKESLECKRQELREANDLNETLTGELMCVKNELQSLRSNALEKANQGNSLFAEVDDRRVYLQDRMNKMKSSYESMKHQVRTHLNEISRLKRENMMLSEEYNRGLVERDEDDDLVLTGYQDRIRVLEKMVTSYETQLNEKMEQLDMSQFNYFQSHLQAKNKEIKSLQEDIASRSLERIMLSKYISNADAEKRKWRSEATFKQCQFDLFYSKLQERGIEKLDDLIEEVKINVQCERQKLEDKQTVFNTENIETPIEENFEKKLERLKNDISSSKKPKDKECIIIDSDEGDSFEKTENLKINTEDEIVSGALTTDVKDTALEPAFNVFEDQEKGQEKATLNEVDGINKSETVPATSNVKAVEDAGADIFKKLGDLKRDFTNFKKKPDIKTIDSKEECIVIDSEEDIKITNKENETKLKPALKQTVFTNNKEIEEKNVRDVLKPIIVFEDNKEIEENTVLSETKRKKVVAFSECTVEPKVTKRHQLRGGRLLTGPPPHVIITSSLKPKNDK